MPYNLQYSQGQMITYPVLWYKGIKNEYFPETVNSTCRPVYTVSIYYNQTSRSTLDDATYARRVASTGVLQGDAANANVRPARYA